MKYSEFYGITGLPLSWLSTYLKDISQFINYNNCRSNTTNIDIGVPNDLFLSRSFFFYLLTCRPALLIIILYYDTNIIISDFSAKKLKSKLQLTINDIMLWVSANKLTINNDKTH